MSLLAVLGLAWSLLYLGNRRTPTKTSASGPVPPLAPIVAQSKNPFASELAETQHIRDTVANHGPILATSVRTLDNVRSQSYGVSAGSILLEETCGPYLHLANENKRAQLVHFAGARLGD